MEKSIVNFDVSQEYYISKSIDYEISGNLFGAVLMVKRALELKDDLYLRLKLASHYEYMGLYGEANDIYINIIAKKGPAMHCFFALCDNMLRIGNDLAVGYYVTQYNNLAYAEEEKDELLALIERHNETLSKKIYTEVPHWVTEPKSKYYEQGLDALEKENYELAVAKFSKVPISSESGIFAREGIIAASHNLSRYDEAAKVGEEILLYNSSHIMSLIAVLENSLRSKQEEKYQTCLRRILEAPITDEKEVEVIAMELILISEATAAAMVLKRHLAEYPYHLKLKYIYAAICYNEGLYEIALEQFIEIMKVSDPYCISGYYKNICQSHIEKGMTKKPAKKMPYRPEVYESESVNRSDELIRAIATMGVYNDDEQCERIWQDGHFRCIVSWCLTKLHETPFYRLIEHLFEYPCKSMKEFFEDALLFTFYSDDTKRDLLKNCAQNATFKKATFSFGGIICETRLDAEVISYPEVFKKAYANFIYMLAPVVKGYERQLKKVIRHAVNVCVVKNLNLKKHEAVAAVLASQLDFFKEKVSDLEICKMFDCSLSLMEKYRKELDF